MSDISTVTVNNETYNLKDSDARANKADIIIGSAQGDVTVIRDAGAYPVTGMVLHIEPKQAWRGTPTPTNVRALSGWTGTTIKKIGKNYFNANNWTFTTANYSLIVIDGINAMTVKQDANQETKNNYVLPRITNRVFTYTYTIISRTSTSAKFQLKGYKADGTAVTLQEMAVKTVNETKTIKIKILDDIASIAWGGWGYAGEVSITNMQLEVDAPTDYEAYTESAACSYDWTSTAGTIYGADLNVSTGLMTKTYEIIDLGTLSWSYHNTYPVFYGYPTLAVAESGKCYCSIYSNGNTNENVDYRIELGKYGWFQSAIIVHDTRYGTDASAFKTAMSGIYLVYELKNPSTTYQLTANEIQLTKGFNSFTADAGWIFAQYKTDTKPYVDKGKVYFIRGTQAASTNKWTGDLPEVEELYEGLTINYWLPYAGTSSAATLNLTLKNGVKTGDVYVYYAGTTRQTTHLPASAYGQFVYQTVSINNVTYTGWWMLKAYLDGNTTDIVNLYDGSAVYKAHSVIYRYQLLFQVSTYYLTPLNNNSNATGTSKTMLTDVAFDAFGKIFYYYTTTTVNADANIGTSNVYYHRNAIDARYTFNCGQTLTAHSNFYLKVVPQGNGMVKLASDPCWAQELPATNDNNWYIFLGKAYSTYQIQLHTEHPVYVWQDNGWVEILDPRLGTATTTNAGLMSADDKTKLNGIATGANAYTLPKASSSTLGGLKIGNGLSIDNDGVVSVDGGTGDYVLPKASADTLGGIKVGTNLSINSSTGVLSATDTKYTPSTESIGSASAGTAISADDITSWSAGSATTLGTAISADDITAWDAGSVPTLGTAIAADDITAWDAGSLPSASVENEVLTLTFGSLPSLSYTARSIPNVTNVGSVPSLSYTARTIPNVTNAGTAPTLEYTARTIPNISVTSKTVVTGITEA